MPHKDPAVRLAKNREYKRNNKDMVRSANAKWRAKNVEKIKESSRLYRLKNKEKRAEYNRIWVSKNKERYNERVRKWQRANPDKARAWAVANKDRVIANQKRWKKENPGKLREYRARYHEKHKERISNLVRMRRGLPEPTRPKPTLCECCGRVPTKKGFALDHCHKSGKFRGWLCLRCNVAIGALGDTLSGVMSAVDYLRKNDPEASEP